MVRRGRSAPLGGVANRDHHPQHQHLQRHAADAGRSSGNSNFSSGSHPPPIRRKSTGDFVREMPNDNNNNHRNSNSSNRNSRNQGSEQDAAPRHPQRRLSQDSAVTQVHRNTRRAETFVSNMRDYNNMASAPPSEAGGRLRGSGTAAGGNAARIIAERKRKTTGSIDNRSQRRDPLAPGDLAFAPKRRATGGDPHRDSIRRVNTAAGELEKKGNHNFEPQRLQQTGTGSMRRNSTGVDLRQVDEHKAFGNSNVSEIYDEFNDTSFHRGNPNRRRTGGTDSNRSSNEHTYPSGVGGRRRTTRSDGGSRRASRSSSAGRDSYGNGNNPQSASDVDPTGADIQEELHQLRMNHHRQQQQQSPHRQQGQRRSSMTNSERSYDLDEGGMAVISAPMGGRLSDNPNSEMGGFLREAAYEANKSEHSWYMGKDASRSSRYSSIQTTRHSTDGPMAASRHSTAPSVAVSAVPSTQTNDQRMFNDLLQGFNPRGRRRSSGDDLLIGFTPRRKGRKLKWYERHSLSKRTIIIAVVLLFLAIAMLGVVLLLSERGIGFGSGNDSVEKNLTGPGGDVTYVKPPPSDIDGRCSSSNLPGSLPACLEACYPAACCYSNDSGTKCLEASDAESIKACNLYRPYCDIFHDTWDGATDGVLRTPRADLVPICRQVNGMGGEQKLRARNLLSRNLLVGTAEVVCEQYCEAAKCCAVATDYTYSAGLQLSASGVYTDATTKEYVVTNCQDSLAYQKNKDLCAEYDKFCMWDGGGETTVKKDVWTSRPTMDPASTMVPSTSPSIIPSASPSTSLRPSPLSSKPSYAPSINVFTISWITPITKRPVPSPSMTPSNSFSPSQKFKPSSQPSLSSMPTISRANITSVEASCAGADNIALMANGNETARTKCLDACLNGLCCYTEQLGYSSFIESCYVGNEAVCEEYSACLWLQQSGELTLDSTNETTPTNAMSAELPQDSKTETAPNDAILNSSFNSNETMIMNANISSTNSSLVVDETTAMNNNITSLNTNIVIDGTPAPSSNPSSVSIETATGTQYISGGVNITEVTMSANVDTPNSSTPNNTTPSTAMNVLTIPPPPSDLAALCALGQGRFCTEVCKDVSCCFEEAPELNCVSDNVEICQGYAPCSVLYPQGS
uniref:Uncharacterized protein n=1 Tax=Skeletonema marinoi TaxID=267567 RepID=A0A7S2KIK3_9STRA|mmetsp:Transcript_13525/g.22744  ORF Transcript_13525/g.22744 Transcript_13525/m.22744 type:complete len:1133 (+) Transcript_13525:39-3437(+)